MLASRLETKATKSKMMKVVAATAVLAGAVSALPLLKGQEARLAAKYPFESAAGIRSILDSALSLVCLIQI